VYVYIYIYNGSMTIVGHGLLIVNFSRSFTRHTR